MKVLHIIDSGGLYGAEKVILSLMQSQAELGITSVLGSIGTPDIDSKIVETVALGRGVSVKKFRMRKGLNLLGAWRILKYAESEGFDLIHSHGYKGNIILGMFPRRVRRRPIIATLHGWTGTGRINRMAAYSWLDSKVLSLLDGVVVVSKSMLNHPEINSHKFINLTQIDNGIEFRNGTEKGEIRDDINQFCRASFTVGSLGRLSPEKGYNQLIEAIGLLNQQGLPIQLLILGEGPERRRLEYLIQELGLQSRVSLPGYTEDGNKYLKYIDLYVSSSQTEGFPISVLETMAAGRPIVATNVGGIPEILDYGHAGQLVKSDKPQALAKAISKLYHNSPLREEMVRRAKSIVQTRYSAEKMASEYNTFYKRVLNRDDT